MEITFLNPPSRERPRRGRRGHLLNNASLAMILKFDAVRILLAGDIEKEAEVRMMTAGLALKADLLKVPAPRQRLFQLGGLPGAGEPGLCRDDRGPRGPGKAPPSGGRQTV